MSKPLPKSLQKSFSKPLPMVEGLEGRTLWSFTIPGTDIDIPIDDIPGIDIPDIVGGKSVNESVFDNRKRYGVPALIAATLKDGKLDEIAAAGVRQAGNADRARWGDPFVIGSGSKAMTATLAARIVERGYMKWDTKLIDVFPGYLGKIRPTYYNVTLEQLLAHRGGMPENLRSDLNVAVALADNGYEGRQNYLRSMLRQKAVAAPGTYHYSNVGYIVAGAMMEGVMREPFENMMQRLVFKPLGMTSAGFGWPGSSSKLDAPRAHDPSGKPQKPNAIFQIPDAYNPSGGVHVNIIDWAKFVGLQLGQVPKRFLTDESIKKLREPYDGPGTKYGLGWNIVETGPLDDLIQHDGTEGFWYASVIASPDSDRAVLVMTNRGGVAGERAVHETIRDLTYRLYVD